jgi:hypothetical protein
MRSRLLRLEIRQPPRSVEMLMGPQFLRQVASNLGGAEAGAHLLRQHDLGV